MTVFVVKMHIYVVSTYDTFDLTTFLCPYSPTQIVLQRSSIDILDNRLVKSFNNTMKLVSIGLSITKLIKSFSKIRRRREPFRRLSYFSTAVFVSLTYA